MSLENKTLSCKRIVHYSDCDPLAHLNNARYIDYLMNSREEQLYKQLNFSIREYSQKEGKGWFVLKNQIAYLSPAFYTEEIAMESRLILYDKRDSIVEMLMYNSNKSKIKSVLWSHFRHVNIKTGKSEDHPEFITDLFNENLTELTAKSFDERITEFRKQKSNSSNSTK